MWITLIMMLISYFMQKKNGASSGKAALTAAAVGAGTYYVATQTTWGQDLETSLESGWNSLTNSDGTPVTNKDGSAATAPPGSTPKLDAGGSQMYDSNGNALFNLTSGAIKTTGDVLQSWGPTGTAAVVGTTALAADKDTRKYLLWGGIALAAVLLIK